MLNYMKKTNDRTYIRWMKGIALLVVLNNCYLYTAAQFKITEVTVGTSFIPSSRYIRPEDSVKTHASTIQYRFNAGLAFQLASHIDTATGKVRTWSGSLNGIFTRQQNQDYQKQIFPDDLFAADISIQHYRSLHNRWAFLGLVSVGLYSDLRQVDGNDIFVNAGGIFIKQFARNFSLGFGGFVNNNFGAPMLWPALFVQWRLDGKYRLDISVPDKGPGLAYNISITRKFNPQYELSLGFKPRLMTYDVENRSNPDKRLMGCWELPIGLENHWHMGRVEIFGGGGIMPLRSTSFGEKKISDIFSKKPAHKLATNFYLNAGARIRF